MKRLYKSVKVVTDYTFYCDRCSEKIGEEISVVEGGSYQQPGHVCIKIEINGEHHEKELHLCKEEMLKKYKPPLDPYKDDV